MPCRPQAKGLTVVGGRGQRVASLQRSDDIGDWQGKVDAVMRTNTGSNGYEIRQTKWMNDEGWPYAIQDRLRLEFSLPDGQKTSLLRCPMSERHGG
uniref:Calpain catalytic domain-containing protein n=1 Tax=Panagrellus redivivus TaxID=6233 RepID=A0A7E4UZI7_PANRE